MIAQKNTLRPNGVSASPRVQNGIRRSLPIIGLGFAAALLSACGSSGGGGGGPAAFQHAAPKYAAAGSANYAATLEGGAADTVRMNQDAYRVDANGNATRVGDEAANFTINAGAGPNRSITIQTADFTHTWNAATVGNGRVSSLAEGSGNPLDTFADIDAQYYDFVNFGYWEVLSVNANTGAQTARGGAFHQGLETNPTSMPTTGTATYVGTTHGKLLRSGEAARLFDGTVQLTATFGGATPAVTGTIQTDFNTVGLSGNISGNGFSGTTSASAGTAAHSFADGAAGTVNGKFYGTAAQEVGGVWNLQDGGNIAVGGFGGQQVTP